MRTGRDDWPPKKAYPNYRTVSVRRHDGLLIRVDPVSNWGTYAFILSLMTIGAGAFTWQIVAVLLREWSGGSLALVALIAVIWATFPYAAWMLLEDVCTVEISVRHGRLRWSYGILSWRREAEADPCDVVNITATHKWHGNRLEVTTRGTTFRLEKILDDDLDLITRELRQVLTGQPG